MNNTPQAIVRSRLARYWVFLGLLLMMLIQFSPGVSWAGTDTVYTISAIPPVTAWPGNSVVFKVNSAKLGAGAALSYTKDGAPRGAVTFDAATGQFSYTPDPVDKQPFSVTFTATLGSDTDTQTVQITPLPLLPPEQEVFGLKADPTKLPDPEDKSFIVRNEYAGATEESFNYASRKTRTVSIIGKKLVFQEGHPNSLFDYNNNENIKEMRIYAETVVIRSPLHLPQTNVIIYARYLRFEDQAGSTEATKARLITTPISLTTRPDQFANGANGLKRGDVNPPHPVLFCRSRIDCQICSEGWRWPTRRDGSESEVSSRREISPPTALT